MDEVLPRFLVYNFTRTKSNQKLNFVFFSKPTSLMTNANSPRPRQKRRKWIMTNVEWFKNNFPFLSQKSRWKYASLCAVATQ